MGIRYAEICTYHQGFGGIGNSCDAEHYEVVDFSINLVYRGLIDDYGGEQGVAKGYALIYFPYITNLPLPGQTKSKYQLWSIVFTPWSWLYDAPSTFSPATARISPREATPATPYDYSFGAYLSRGYDSFTANKQAGGSMLWCADCGFYQNMSLCTAVGQSTLTQSATNFLPFAVAAKQFGAAYGDDKRTTQFKVMSMLLAYVMAHRFMKVKMMENVDDAPLCEAGCPVMDANMIDNGPLVPTFAYLSKLPSNIRPTYVFANGAAANFDMYKVHLGTGPINIWTGGYHGGNSCPFTALEQCTILETVRKIWVANNPQGDLGRDFYEDIGNAYRVWAPEYQTMAPFCGDPMAYDGFYARCTADSYCGMLTTIVPSSRALIDYTVDAVVVNLVAVYVGPTTLSEDYVELYVPLSLLQLPFFKNMRTWFPSYNVQYQEEKGGLAFTKAAGNPFIDFMTFLNARISQGMYKGKQYGWLIYTGASLPCGYMVYDMMKKTTESAEDFVASEKTLKSALG
jgi:hypothetical protein